MAVRSSGSGEVNAMSGPRPGGRTPERCACRKKRPDAESFVRRPVAGVAHDRMADGRHVDADLVGAAALQARARAASSASAPRMPALEHPVGGAGRLAPGGHRHLRRRAGRTPDRRLDLAPVVRDLALDQRQVSPLHRPGRQLVHQRPVGVGRAGHGQEPRGPLVEPVHDARPVRRRTRPPRPARPGRGTGPAGRRPACPRRGRRPGARRARRACPPPPRRRRRGPPRRCTPGSGATPPHPRPAAARTVSTAPSRSAVRPTVTALAVDQHPPGADQLGCLGPRDVGHHGDAPVHPDAGQQRRHLRRDRLAVAPPTASELTPSRSACARRRSRHRRAAPRSR